MSIIQTIDWENLKELRCPKCYEDLTGNEKMGYVCAGAMCDFEISELKIKEIVTPMFNKNNDAWGRLGFEELIEANNK